MLYRLKEGEIGAPSVIEVLKIEENYMYYKDYDCDQEIRLGVPSLLEKYEIIQNNMENSSDLEEEFEEEYSPLNRLEYIKEELCDLMNQHDSMKSDLMDLLDEINQAIVTLENERN